MNGLKFTFTTQSMRTNRIRGEGQRNSGGKRWRTTDRILSSLRFRRIPICARFNFDSLFAVSIKMFIFCLLFGIVPCKKFTSIILVRTQNVYRKYVRLEDGAIPWICASLFGWRLWIMVGKGWKIVCQWRRAEIRVRHEKCIFMFVYVTCLFHIEIQFREKMRAFPRSFSANVFSLAYKCARTNVYEYALYSEFILFEFFMKKKIGVGNFF